MLHRRVLTAPATPPAATATGRDVPLCVDLDGTLVRTDCLWEAALQILFRRPLRMLAILGGSWRGRAWLKRALGREALLPVKSLPYNPDVIALIAQARSAGRRTLLVTASDQLMADSVAAYMQLFDEAIGSDGVSNLRGKTKAALLVKKFGRGGFDYAGDSAVDIPVWEAARHAYAVNPEPAAGRWVAQRGGGGTTLGAPRRAGRALLRALRPRHWVKNTLVFLPMLAAPLWHQGQVWWRLAAFFLALCFGASTICLINDLADIESDRRHKDTGRSPVATGDLLIAETLLAIPLCLALAVCFSSLSGWKATQLLLVYMVAAGACSFCLKRAPILGVPCLAGLCLFRILAGAVLAPVKLSPWQIAVALFLFLILAAAKRHRDPAGLAEDPCSI